MSEIPYRRYHEHLNFLKRVKLWNDDVAITWKHWNMLKSLIQRVVGRQNWQNSLEEGNKHGKNRFIFCHSNFPN